jgi:lipopolysaccharide export system permease protein
VLLLTNLLKEILTLLVNHQATFRIVGEALALLVPFVMAFALPMGMLTAALLVFGRFSADQELTAARASGLSLVSLVTPVLLLSVLLSLICGLFNLDIAPRCRVAYKEMPFRLGLEASATLVQEDRFVDFPGWVVYTRKRQGDRLQDVRLYEMEGRRIRTTHTASAASLELDPGGGKFRVVLTNATTITLLSREATELAPEPNGNGDPAAAEAQMARWQTVSFEELPLEIELPKSGRDVRKPKLSEMSFRQLSAEIREREEQGIDTTPAQVQLHRQVAFSFASLGFTLVGIPLGIRAHRRETTAGIAMALLLVLVYYSFIIVAQSWETRPDLWPQLVVWLPNFLFQAVGAVLLWHANRGL